MQQDCIKEVRLWDGEDIEHDFSTFRNGGYRLGDTIMERQRRWVNAEVEIGEPWLRVEGEDGNTTGKIVVNRGARWKGFVFPWKELVRVYGDAMVFVGLEDEHAAFCKEYGRVEYYETRDMLDVGRAIAGAEYFIGNQSACNAIANGLHKASLLEVCPFGPDCFYPRGNARYCIDGEVEVEVLGRKLSVRKAERLGFGVESEIRVRLMAEAELARERAYGRSVTGIDEAAEWLQRRSGVFGA